ncbi:polysaccharide deacetylase family protein [Aliarcobacter cryaerophilus]|uniref:polysaccharide deacetylase family protein n=1 Tax=Aliarcobacter cryaerophilus TaxID=28198 RepID=UPI0021B6104E|nr:polysaccharide deacetylase family protein [Aliarcobacter cryaerophilus]MCT7405743.1 polysaccharide deacetylase family protein [Aliarcobacter cryaerophilus]MCT7503314.1 polysaccharide deacetylase family protein [Aliarcobacter cryaerophilus]
MIKITIPNNNIAERKYILDIIFDEFLGLDFKVLESDDCQDWEIELENGNKLIIQDHFFNKSVNNLEYLKLENIPLKVEFVKNQFIVEDDIPIIYGNTKLETKNDELKTIICGIDIFASSFFMLTRWEEYVNKNRDFHDRFSAIQSLAYKQRFLDRPIVNEYVEMLKNMLLELDNNLKFKIHNSKLFISCDVDQPYDCTVENIQNLIRVGAGDIIKRKSVKEFVKRFRRYVFNKFGNYKYDENYTFDWYMNVCEKAGTKAAFYFIPTSIEKQNGCYELQDKKIQNLIKYIDSRGHEIGVHGSYQTYKDKEKAKLQKNILNNTLLSLGIRQKVLGNRQHYLRWDSSITPMVLEYAGFEYDTTGSYADRPGFRYGVCYEFSMFDILNRKKLSIKQRPLIVMECTIIDDMYMGLGYSEEALQVMKELKQKCFKYNGNFSLLWHNSHFCSKDDKKMFEEIVK